MIESKPTTLTDADAKALAYWGVPDVDTSGLDSVWWTSTMRRAAWP
jgi:hypothetical protein